MVGHGKSPFVVSIQLWNNLRLPMKAFAVASATILAIGISVAQPQGPSLPKRSEILRDRPLPLTKFYDTPDPLPAGKPGDLIRSQPFDEYQLPFSVSAIRILYHSRSANGEDLAVSGVVLIPYDKKPPAGGWPGLPGHTVATAWDALALLR